MRHYFVICFLLISQGLYSQSNLTFKYLLTDNTLKRPVKTPLFDSLITTKRQIISSNEFIDFGILCSDFSRDCSIKFKIDDKQNWFVFFEKKWKKIYEASNNKLQNVDIKSNEVSIVPVLNKEIAGGKYPLLCYRIFDQKRYDPDNNVLFWFHPQHGIVVIESGHSYYVREDFFKTLNERSLSSDNFGSFEFQTESTLLTTKGQQDLIKFSKWFINIGRKDFQIIYLRGLITKDESKKNNFLGVNRCKAIIDSLNNYGISKEIFFITNEEIQPNEKPVGVGFILDKRKTESGESKEEDEYFKPSKKGKNKN